jgi:hypothetical protein
MTTWFFPEKGSSLLKAPCTISSQKYTFKEEPIS